MFECRINAALIEFLESTVQGKSYRLLRGGPPLGPHVYPRSGDMLESFIVNRAPFNTELDVATAHDFCEGVRCGLLHEARTKNGWVSARRKMAAGLSMRPALRKSFTVTIFRKRYSILSRGIRARSLLIRQSKRHSFGSLTTLRVVA